jgi:hypothetical protein
LVGGKFMDSLNNDSNSVNKDIKFAFNSLFEEVKEELDEHLDAINQSTNEISANYEYLVEIDFKINKLSEKIEQLQLFLEQNFGYKSTKQPKFQPKPLTNNEQDVFLVLAMLEEKKGAVTYGDIAKRTGLSDDLISNYVTRMIEKNVPIIKRYVNNQPFLRLDPQFKKLQEKENILGLKQKTISSF